MRQERPKRHWLVRFTRRGCEPPRPFGKTEEVVCAPTRDEAKEVVPASTYYPVTASLTGKPVGYGQICRCASGVTS